MPLSLFMRLMSKYEVDVEDIDNHKEVGDDDGDKEFIEEHGYVYSQ